MLAPFSPASLSFRAATNSTGPLGDDLAFANRIPSTTTFPQDAHFDPAPNATAVSAAIEPATGPIQVRDLLAFDVEFVRIFDPDVGKFVRVKALSFAGSHEGAGSIQVAGGQVLLVRLTYQAGPVVTTETANLVIATPDSDRARIPLSLTTFVPDQAQVATKLSTIEFQIVPGGTANVGITVRSISGAADVHFEKSNVLLDAKVSMKSLTVHVDDAEEKNRYLVFHADPDAKLGTFDLAVQQFAPNRLPFLALRVTIGAPTWLQPIPSGVVAVHAALVPGVNGHGEIILFGGDQLDVEASRRGDFDHAARFDCRDTTQPLVATHLPNVDVFCCGHAFLGDGRLLIAGGTAQFPDDAPEPHQGRHHFDG